MANSKNKLAQELTPDELAEFCMACQGVPHGELVEKILKLAADREISIGKSSAYNFREKELMPFMERLRRGKEKAAAIAELDLEDSGTTLADAAAGQVSQLLFDFVMDVDEMFDLSTKDGRAKLDQITKSIKRMRDGDRAQINQQRKLIEDTREDLKNEEMTPVDREARMRARFGV